MGHYQVNTEQQHWYGTGRANIIENRREERAPEFDESCKRAFFYPNISLENKSGFLRYFFSISVFNILVIFWSHIHKSLPRSPPPTLTAFVTFLSGSCIFAIRDVVVFLLLLKREPIPDFAPISGKQQNVKINIISRKQQNDEIHTMPEKRSNSGCRWSMSGKQVFKSIQSQKKLKSIQFPQSVKMLKSIYIPRKRKNIHHKS